jgi:DNA-binding Lrp family transcriptional regulator
VYSREEIIVLQALQNELPLCSSPFKALSKAAGMDEERFLELAGDLIERGVIRRIGAALNHRKLNIQANALVMWAVPDNEVNNIGRQMADCPEVTHCYRRTTPVGWEYQLFSMLHACTREECLSKITDLANQLGMADYQVLFSTFEYKKTVMHYGLQEVIK